LAQTLVEDLKLPELVLVRDGVYAPSLAPFGVIAKQVMSLAAQGVARPKGQCEEVDQATSLYERRVLVIRAAYNEEGLEEGRRFRCTASFNRLLRLTLIGSVSF
jgi:hypothetical protein